MRIKNINYIHPRLSQTYFIVWERVRQLNNLKSVLNIHNIIKLIPTEIKKHKQINMTNYYANHSISHNKTSNKISYPTTLILQYQKNRNNERIENHKFGTG